MKKWVCSKKRKVMKFFLRLIFYVGLIFYSLNCSITFGSRDSNLKVSSGAHLNINSSNLLINGMLIKESNALLDGNIITFQNGILNDGTRS
jgi:hypothetical protein